MNSYRAWTTADGRTVPLAEMRVSHIENCIAHLEQEIERYADDIALSESFIDSDTAAAVLGGGLISKKEAIRLASIWINEFHDELHHRAAVALVQS